MKCGQRCGNACSGESRAEERICPDWQRSAHYMSARYPVILHCLPYVTRVALFLCASNDELLPLHLERHTMR